jgi:hypothetical protein
MKLNKVEYENQLTKIRAIITNRRKTPAVNTRVIQLPENPDGNYT